MRKRKCLLTKDLKHDYFDGTAPVEVHHIFGGANRKKSEKDGLIIPLSHARHNEPPFGAHFNREFDLQLKRMGEEAWIREYASELPRKIAIDRFRERYGRNYLEVEA